MRKNSVRAFTRVTLVIIVCIALTGGAFSYPSGSPAGYTGSPGDGQHCVSCHGGSAATVSGWITSNIPAQGYSAGVVYSITVTVSGTGKKGFEVSPQNVTGTQLGVLAAGTGSHLVGGTKYVTQNSSGSTSSTVSWSFTWTAPSAGTGDVTFYGAFTVGKTNTKLSTLEVVEDAGLPLSATASASPGLVCTGQTSQLGVSVSGGSGTYSYSWTSVPPGFISSLQNPVVSPEVATQYTVHVSDGTLGADAVTNVGVNQPATASAGNDTTCAYATTLVPLSGTASNYASVLWTTSGTGTFSNAGSLTGNYLPSAADKTGGNVILTLTAAAQLPCTAPAAGSLIIHFDAPTGFADPQTRQGEVVISPNPNNGKFMLRYSTPENGKVTVTITGTTGKFILQRISDGNPVIEEQFDLSGYPKGIYLVNLQTGDHSLVRKLVIE